MPRNKVGPASAEPTQNVQEVEINEGEDDSGEVVKAFVSVRFSGKIHTDTAKTIAATERNGRAIWNTRTGSTIYLNYNLSDLQPIKDDSTLNKEGQTETVENEDDILIDVLEHKREDEPKIVGSSSLPVKKYLQKENAGFMEVCELKPTGLLFFDVTYVKRGNQGAFKLYFKEAIGINRKTPSEEEQALKESHASTLFLIPLLLVCLYLLIGVIFYMLVEGFAIVDSVYFSVTVLSFIGYGSVAPTDDRAKIFTIVYAWFAPVVAAMCLGLLSGPIVERRFVELDAGRVPRKRTALVFFCCLLMPVLGASVMYKVEGFNTLDATLYAVTTLTTLGTGAVSPKSSGAKWFYIVYSLVSYVLVLSVFLEVAEWFLLFHMRKHKASHKERAQQEALYNGSRVSLMSPWHPTPLKPVDPLVALSKGKKPARTETSDKQTQEEKGKSYDRTKSKSFLQRSMDALGLGEKRQKLEEEDTPAQTTGTIMPSIVVTPRIENEPVAESSESIPRRKLPS
eukprot:Colp12_sorted_trinity150504_noHs@2315